MPRIVLQDRSPKSTRWFMGLGVALFLSVGPTLAQTPFPTAAQQLPTIQLRAGMHLITAEVAQTPREHEIGLMWRTSMGANSGMLFVFPRASQQCFWMKNTLIPLAVAFLADDGSIVNMDEMQAQTDTPHCSAKPVRYVLEMNNGWFGKRGLKANAHITGDIFTAAR